MEAKTFEEAVQLARQGIDLAVCDPNVVGNDCEEFMQQWAMRSRKDDVPLVVVSEERDLRTRLSALGGGAKNFVVKPAHPSLLFRNLNLFAYAPGTAQRLLVVDDSRTYGHALAEALALDGHDVVLAASAQEARTYLAHEKPDAILLDVFLPDGDGVDLARALRGAEGTRNLPLMMLTGRENTVVRQRASEAGIAAFASKNMPLQDIRLLVATALVAGNRPLSPPKPAPRLGGRGGRELFAKLVATSGLSEVVARSTLELALRRAGIEIADLSVASLQTALPNIEQSLGTFLPPAEVRQRVMAISKLCKESRSVE
jgi:DNA-binding response OmpR family regulator